MSIENFQSNIDEDDEEEEKKDDDHGHSMTGSKADCSNEENRDERDIACNEYEHSTQHRQQGLRQRREQQQREAKQQEQQQQPIVHCVQKWRKWLRAYIRNVFDVDSTELTLVPPMRTAIILMVEWIIFGVANNRSTGFQLGALYVGLTDPNVSLGRRLHYMGLTEIVIVVVGAIIPSLVWDIPWLHFLVAIPISYFTGLAPLLDSDALAQAMKLGTALYAINSSVNRNTNGYGGFGVSVLWTFYGATTSLIAALIPEMIGNRDAARTDMYKVWHGFGRNLQRWGSKWFAWRQFEQTPKPTVTIAIARTENSITNDSTEDVEAKEWFLSLVRDADTMRTLTFCVSNGYSRFRFSTPDGHNDRLYIESDATIDDLMRALGRMCNSISYLIQFPLVYRYILPSQKHLRRALDNVKAHGLKLKTMHETTTRGSSWLPPLMDLLLHESEHVVDKVTNFNTWPRHPSIRSIPERVSSAFPSKIKLSKEGERQIIQSYAIRFAFAFSVASIPDLFFDDVSAHWFPMTVALIMGPSQSATLPKVGQRIMGTILGIGLGSLLSPLFRFSFLLIALMGLNTYAACVYFKANYTLFTLFITVFVFTTTVGSGSALGITIIYRCAWTVSAGVLVLLVTYAFPLKSPVNVTKELIDFCRALKVYAECVLIARNAARDQKHETSNNSPASLADLSGFTEKARDAVIRARVTVLCSIHDSVVLTPRNEQIIDPHTLAPAIASDLIDAVVVPQFASLVHDDSVDDLMCDFDQKTFTELDRLIHRLEFLSPDPDCTKTKVVTATPGQASKSILSAPSTHGHFYYPSSNRGPFSSAIATAHRRLDDLCVPSDAIIEEEKEM